MLNAVYAYCDICSSVLTSWSPCLWSVNCQSINLQ